MQNEKTTVPMAFVVRLRECRGIEKTRDMAGKVDRILVVEEGYPFVEE